MIWWQIIIATFVLLMYGRLVIWLYHFRNHRMQQKWIMQLKMLFPESKIVFVSVSGRESEALQKLKNKMHEGEDENSPLP